MKLCSHSSTLLFNTIFFFFFFFSPSEVFEIKIVKSFDFDAKFLFGFILELVRKLKNSNPYLMILRKVHESIRIVVCLHTIYYFTTHTTGGFFFFFFTSSLCLFHIVPFSSRWLSFGWNCRNLKCQIAISQEDGVWLMNVRKSDAIAVVLT